MIRIPMGAALALLLAVPGALTAQARDREMRILINDDQPRLGVGVSTLPDSVNDRVGAKILNVMPGTPADKAGLQVGDIITRVNGTSLASTEASDKTPGERLVELAERLSPGDTVKLDYRRGSESRSATLVAARIAPRQFALSMPELRLQHALPGGALRLEAPDMQVFGFRTGGLDLVEMNPGLGAYFGTDKGVLVTEDPADSTMPLHAGDVILSIGGRVPQSVGHARRILDSYAGGETVNFEIMRKRSRQTVTWKVPERKDTMFRWHATPEQGMRFRAPRVRPGARIERNQTT